MILLLFETQAARIMPQADLRESNELQSGYSYIESRALHDWAMRSTGITQSMEDCIKTFYATFYASCDSS